MTDCEDDDDLSRSQSPMIPLTIEVKWASWHFFGVGHENVKDDRKSSKDDEARNIYKDASCITSES